jgi:hypothetical protein
MPPEPRKPIEELLEASARARRTEFGADPKMPNPMRARLQDEVARMAQPREPKSPRFAIAWPRLVMGVAFACLLIGAGVIWRQTYQPSEAGRHLAMTKTAPATEMNRAERAPAASDKLETAPQASMADSATGVSRDNKTPELAKAAAAETEPTSQNFRQSASAQVASRAQPLTNFRQQFSQSAGSKMADSSVKLQKAQKLLDNFQVEQNGRDIRVVDDDGSTYAGRIEPLTANDTRNYLKERQTDAAPTAPAPGAKQAAVAEQAPNNEFYFRASGYNASLKKSVVFEGNYIAAAPPGKNQNAAAEKDAAQQPARIVGTAKVPGEAAVPVDAVAVPAK